MNAPASFELALTFSLPGQRFLHQRLDLLAGVRIGGAMFGIDKTVVLIFSGAECADAIQLVKQRP
jgi:hypothetical protein